MSRFSIFLLALFPLQIIAQKITEGRILDASDSTALLGAHLLPLGDWRGGVVTDLNGRFSSAFGASDSLVISFVGYEEVVVSVKHFSDNGDFYLKPNFFD